MSISYYVDINAADDSGTGLTPESPKKYIPSVIALITTAITEDITIFIQFSGTPYTQEFDFQNLTFGVGDAKLIMQAWEWNDGRYDGAEHSPMGAMDDWDVVNDAGLPRIEYNVYIVGNGRLVLRGLEISPGTESDNAGLIAENGGVIIAQYCRFVQTPVVATSNSQLTLENCSISQTEWGVGGLNSQITLSGDVFITEPTAAGIYLNGGSTLRIEPWGASPSHFTTEIKTSYPRAGTYGMKFAYIRACEGSMVLLQNWNPTAGGLVRVHVRHEHVMLPADQYGVLLESRAMLIGANQIDFTKKDEKGDTVSWSGDNQICGAEGQGTLSI